MEPLEISVPPSSTQQEFTVSFIREDDTDHDISARDLGIALLGLSTTFERVNYLLSGDAASVALRVDGTFEGSFASKCVLLTALADSAQLALQGDFDTARWNLVNTVLGPAGLVENIKLFGKQKEETSVIESTRDSDEHMGLHVGFELETAELKYQMSSDMLKLFDDKDTRDGLIEFVSILHGETDRIDVTKDDEPLTSIETGDAHYFSYFQPEVDAQTTLEQQRLQIVTVAFDLNHVWHMKKGQERSQSYIMRDQEFISSVAHGREFRHGDMLVCQVLITVETTGDTNRERREIIKVLDHYSQTRLEV